MKKILIIEDDPDIRETLQDILQDEGLAADTAVNGQAGLDYLNACAELPALILVDLSMPVMDGIEFCLRAQKVERFRAIPLVVLSADRQPDKRMGACRVTDYVRKPVDLAALLAKIRELAV